MRARSFVTPVALLLLLALLLWGSWWGYKNITAPPPSAPVTPCVTVTVGPKLVSSRVTVNVYNGGHTPGAAKAVAKQLAAKGFQIGKVGNTQRRVTVTEVEGHSATDPAVVMVAGFFKGAKVNTDDRSDGTVDVFIGTQYGGFNDSAPNVVQASTNTACLPVSHSPTPSGSASPAAPGPGSATPSPTPSP